MDKGLIEDKLYQSIDEFNEKNNHRDIQFFLIDCRHPFYDGNG